MMNYYLPSEWHKQVAVQLTWPHALTDWAPYLDDIVKMELEMAKQITLRERLVVATPYPDEVRDVLSKELDDNQMDRVEVHYAPTNDTWARDHAALTLLSCEDKKEKMVKLLDFRFNGWGEKFVADKDNLITRCLEEQSVFSGLYGDVNITLEDNDDFVLEGGAIESDGNGTVFTTSFCLLSPHRNQPMKRNDIEEQLKMRLGAQRVVWIDYGQLIGDDTDGHIDTIVRPAPNNVLLYVQCRDKEDEQYEEFRKMEEQLKTFRTIGGEPYTLMPLPMPRAIYDDGDRLPATYANFLIVNGAVLVPAYGQPDLDAEALKTVSKAFPDRDVVGIDAQVAIRQHGSLHCLTMQFPELNK